MGVELMEIALGLGKGVIYAIRWCFRLVCSHPFVFGFLCFMVFLYRTFPLIFSLLVSASPILVCTAVLLGILLSYGQSMVPEIEMGGERIGVGVSRKAKVWEGGVVGENGRRDELEPLTGNLDSVVDEHHAAEERLEGIQLSDSGIEGMSRGLGELRGEVKVKLDNERAGEGEVVENHFVPTAEVVDDAAQVIEKRLEGDRMSDGATRGVSRDWGGVKVKPNDERVGNQEVIENHFAPSVVIADATAQLLEERLGPIRMNDGGIEGVIRGLAELRGEVMEKPDDGGVGVGEVVEEDEKCSSDDGADSFDSEKVHVDSLDSPPESPWARAAEREVDEEEKDEEDVSGSDSGSDQDESLSPDASMEDIMPILDELHPLLEEEVHQAIHVSHDSSDAASERSLTSGTGTTHESDDEIEDHMDSDVANAENDEDGEFGQGDEEELLKSPITWTEEDQKNLMELRSSEIERNQRLENLIMRRNARSLDLDNEAENHDDIDDNEDEEDGQENKEEETQSAITWTEEDQKNLMDLGWSEIERNRRLENLIMRRRAKKNMSMVPERNLAGLESFDLPFNIAPISTRRQNPFDLPHDSDDGSELPPIPGSAPSVLLPRRNPFDIPYDSGEEKPDLLGDEFQKEFTAPRLRKPSFLRQETFHVRPSRFARQDIKMRPYFVPEHTFSEESSSSQFQRQLSELSDSKVSSVPDSESTNSLEDLEERKLAEEDEAEEIDEISEAREVAEEGLSGKPEPIFRPEEVIEGYLHPEPVLSSQSSEGDDSSESDEREVSEIQFQSHDTEDHYPQEGTAQHVEVQATVYHLDSEAAELRDSGTSSSPSLSELSERGSMEAGDEGLSISEIIRDNAADEPGVAAQPSLGSTDLSTMSTVVSVTPERAPVYDLSPREAKGNFSSSLSTSNVHPESHLGSPPVLVELASEGTNQNTGTSIPSNDEILPGSSSLDSLDKSLPKDVSDIREHASVSADFLGLGQRFESKSLLDSSAFSSHVPSSLESLVEASAEGYLRGQNTRAEVPISSTDESIHSPVEHSEHRNLHPSLEDKHSLISETNNLVEITEPTFEGHLTAEQPFGMDRVALSPNSDADAHHEIEGKSIAMLSAELLTPVLNDKSTDEPNSEHLSMPVTSTPFHLSDDDSISQKQTYLKSKSAITMPSEMSALDLASSPSDTFETTGSRLDRQATDGQMDEIKEIEVLLSELDVVGDFNSSQWGSSTSGFEKHVDSVRERFPSVVHSQASTRSGTEFWREEIQVSLVPKLLVGDAELSHQDNGSKEIEKPVVLEASQTDAVVMAITGHSEDRAMHTNPSLISPVHGSSFVEVGPFEYTALHYKQGNDGSTEELKLLNPVDDTALVVEPGKTRGSTLDLHVAGSVPSDDLELPDGNKEKQLKMNSEDGLSEIMRDKVDSSVEVSIVKDVDAPTDLLSTISVEGKGKASQNSKSNSSSGLSSGVPDQD